MVIAGILIYSLFRLNSSKIWISSDYWCLMSWMKVLNKVFIKWMTQIELILSAGK